MILIVYLIENHSHLIKVENHAESACFDMLAIGLDILGPGSIPPRATKNLNSPLVGLFSFGGVEYGKHSRRAP
jgi:hypothetical protein